MVGVAASNSFPASENCTLVANFVQTWSIETRALPAGSGLTRGDGTFTNGTSVTVTASANPGYSFLNRTEGGAVVSTQASFSFTANTEGVLVAHFSPLSPTLQVSRTMSGMVRVGL